ncbi:neuron navigator 3-like isoform X2 [Brienomyrus brachyistius]|uniref:neuron navigator 3-like isoform X2 n=1 Tax=Brienomyrus brachyistius TaxID=42636 RepID=UPI0020B3618B|nr:neuron navigator 3-like isoform X2 [Brienomyrus brachyistius]
MDLPSETARHGKKSTSQMLEDQKKIYTDWANHFLAKSGCPRLIKDLTQDITDGVLLAEIIQIIANEKVEDINGCPRSQSQMIENVDVCLSFLEARGVNTQGLSAEEIRNGNLKTILGLFFSLSRYKQQQQQQQQYYQSLVELQQQVAQQATGAAPLSYHKSQEMQSSITARYAAPPGHSGMPPPQKKATRLPGPPRVPAAGGGTGKAHGATNLNRRSQSFTSIDKNKPLQYASGNDRESVSSIPLPGINGSLPLPACTNEQQLVSAIPSPSTSKPWRSKSMNMKHSATSSMLAVKTPSPATSPTPPPAPSPTPMLGLASDRLRPPLAEAGKAAAGGQRSMLDRFKLVNTRPSPRPSAFPSPGSMAEMPLQEEEIILEYGEEGLMGPGSACSSLRQPLKSGLVKNSSKTSGSKAPVQPKDKEDKGRPKSRASTPSREEKEQPTDTPKKTSKIASLIPKGGKSSAVKKEGIPPPSSGIPKPGTKVSQSGTKPATCPASLPVVGREGETGKPAKGGQAYHAPRPLGGLAGPGGRRTSMVSSSSALGLNGGPVPGNGAVQLPQQQQHNHPNTATVAPFIYRTCSENDCASVAPTDPCLSPSKEDLVYSKTAKQCLEEISGEDPEARRMRTVKNIADLRQNLEETMSSLRGTQISHSTLETTFDATVTTEVNGRGLPALTSRSSPMSWRLNQSPSPRLQAGDAPSLPTSYPSPRSAGANRYGPTDPGRFMYAGPLWRGPTGMRAAEMAEKAGVEGVAEGGAETDVGGYMSDGDILAKNSRPEDAGSGYLTDGGLNLYSRGVSRTPDSTSVRDAVQKGLAGTQVDPDSWDDSSSVSSGLSDTLDNISTDDPNTSSYTDITASPRKSKEPQVGKPKHMAAEVNCSGGGGGGGWPVGEELKAAEEELLAAIDPASKWKHEDVERAGQKMGLPLSQTGSWRRGMTAQVGITPPRTKGTTGTFKSIGKTDDAKASEKGKAAPKNASIQRSPSDVGKSSGDEGKKPPTSLTRPPTGGSFGFKKAGSPGTLVTASGAMVAGSSATLGKLPKSSALGKGNGTGGGVRKTSLDESQPQDDSELLGVGATRGPSQFCSLPRPAKSSTSTVVGRPGPGGKSAGTGKRREGGKVGSGRSSPVTINQTDKEKVAVSDPETPCLSPKSSPTSTGQSGLRQPGSKYPDIASPTFRRLFAAKASSKASSPGTPDSGKCPSLLGSPHGTLARQVSLDSPSSGTGSMGSAGGQSGGSSPLYGRGPELLGSGDALGLSQSPASSPASGLSLVHGGRPWASLNSSSAGSKDTLSYQSMTSLPTSSESIDLVGHHASGPKVMRAGSIKSTLSEGLPLDRNTLPKKGLRHPPSSRQACNEEGKEWLRSHSTGGLQDTGSQSPLSPPGASSTVSKFTYSNLLSPTNLTKFTLPGPSMSRSNSIPAQDSAFDLCREAHALGGSATSLEERPRAMSRSGSFRDSMEEVHGSSLSLVSSTSSLYSATEEKAHSEQIRKLRRELDASQEKVAKLTSQLSSNAHLVAAFEKSLGNMTCRLQSLTMTAEQKESELAELRETIEALKTQNSDAQTAIQVALNGPDHPHQDLQVRRQRSSDSMSSINSATSGNSHASMGSAAEAEAKKKKKKSWLRSSFKQAFSKKKSAKPPSPQSDVEDQADSPLTSSPKSHDVSEETSSSPLKSSPSALELCDCTEAEAEIIMQLKNELREKELKLTDIRLEALSSAHHLDQIREAMNRMQNEIELLKAENDRLKSTGNITPSSTPAKAVRPPSETSSTSSSSSRQSLGLSFNNLNVTDTIMTDILLDDGYEGNLRKEGRSIRIMVTINNSSSRTKGFKCQEYLIGSIGVGGQTKWDMLDGVVHRLFKEYIFRVDPLTSLGLTSDSIMSYRLGDVVRARGSEVPEKLPCGCLVGDSNAITISLKGVKENSIDGLAFDTLIPKTVIQRYLNLLVEHRRIILSGPSGTGKSFLASKLAEFIVAKSGREVTETNVASFNVDHKSCEELRQYLSTLAERCNSEDSDLEIPMVVVLDNLHHISSLGDIFNGFLNCKYHRCPYVIGTMNQGISSSPNLELHHNFRWVLCTNHTEPVKGFLGRFLRRKLIETETAKSVRSNDLVKIVDWLPKTWQHLNSFLEAHSSSDVTIGPRLFLSCPMDADGARVWFTDLWNYSLVPYLLEAVREGLQLYGKRAAWEDPSKWVMDTYPWSSASLQHDWQGLLQLRPEDVGYDSFSAKEGPLKQTSHGESEGDPLMNMLMRLQEAASYSSGQGCDSDDSSHRDKPLDSSLESTL